ncbi:unnamed protein product [Mycena citricolor]|uniref:Carrier domain-containing protein n=1 Tax=Mycena citricolor TaxID=2018698 RepID=A0AAD2HX25_9AGAR|nr:unnamed protein product [Mycena citricolor]
MHWIFRWTHRAHGVSSSLLFMHWKTRLVDVRQKDGAAIYLDFQLAAADTSDENPIRDRWRTSLAARLDAFMQRWNQSQSVMSAADTRALLDEFGIESLMLLTVEALVASHSPTPEQMLFGVKPSLKAGTSLRQIGKS